MRIFSVDQERRLLGFLGGPGQSICVGRQRNRSSLLTCYSQTCSAGIPFFWLKPLSTLCYFRSYCPFFCLLFCCSDSRAAPACLKTSLHIWSCPVHLTGTWVKICLFLKIFYFCKAMVLFVAYCITPSSFASILGVHKCARGVSWCFCGVFCGACMHLLPQCNRLNGQGLLFVRLYVPTLELEQWANHCVSAVSKEMIFC